jgi:pullulanase
MDSISRQEGPEGLSLTASGPSLPTLQITVPEGHTGRRMGAALIYMGRVIGWGMTLVGDADAVPLVVRLVHPDTELPHAECRLIITLNLCELPSFFPGFGDLSMVQIVNPSTLHEGQGLGRSLDWRERRLSRPENRVIIHYHRFDAAYLDATLWTWDAEENRNPQEQDLRPVGWDSFGLIFELDRAEYGWPTPAARIGLLPRLAADWGAKDGPDRFWSPDTGREVWIVGGDPRLHASAPDVSPRILSAHIDDPHRVTAEISRLPAHRPPHAPQIRIHDAAGAPIPVEHAHARPHHGGRHTFVVDIRTARPLELGNGSLPVWVEIHGLEGKVRATPRGVLDRPELFCDADAVMGAVWTAAETGFAVFAPHADAAWVVLYASATGGDGREEHPLHPTGKGVWRTSISGDLEGRFYTLRFEGPLHDAAREWVDPCATNTVDSGRRARITDLARCNPPAWDRLHAGPVIESPSDAVLCELHVRDFSIDASSGAQHRGRYLAFTEAGTRIPEDRAIATGLDHLSDLGVTHVQLLPVHDHANEETAGAYDWGYMTQCFLSPEGMYASSPFDESRVREFKALVAALHDRGIGVVMDVVYNHADPSASFEGIAPGYYYRVLPDGSLANGSGCGNEFRTEAPMARKFVIDSLRHWVREYGVDGFRFDLMALLDRETMCAAEMELRALKPGILLYGEPWMAGPSPLANPTHKDGVRGTGIGAFNDDFRNAVKGPPDHGEPGYIQHGHHRDVLERGIAGMAGSWPDHPAQVINYMTCHDNLVLYDKLLLSRPGATEDEILAMMRLGYLILLTAQGVPFLHGGEEFARSKGGDHNSYRSPDSVNRIDWTLKRRNFGLYRYVRALIALRRAHPLFRLRSHQESEERIAFLHTPRHEAVAYTIEGSGLSGETWSRACVLLNSHPAEPVEFALPPGVWKIALDPDGERLQDVCEGSVAVRRGAGALLFQSPPAAKL